MKILALGNEFRMDDSIALIIADKINAIKAYTNPENFINEGEEVILIDAVDFNADCGSVKSFSPDEINNFALSTTHNMNIDLLAKLCKIKKIIGIQPKKTGYGKNLSEELEAKKNEIIIKVKKLINE